MSAKAVLGRRMAIMVACSLAINGVLSVLLLNSREVREPGPTNVDGGAQEARASDSGVDGDGASSAASVQSGQSREDGRQSLTSRSRYEWIQAQPAIALPHGLIDSVFAEFGVMSGGIGRLSDSAIMSYNLSYDQVLTIEDVMLRLSDELQSLESRGAVFVEGEDGCIASIQIERDPAEWALAIEDALLALRPGIPPHLMNRLEDAIRMDPSLSLANQAVRIELTADDSEELWVEFFASTPTGERSTSRSSVSAGNEGLWSRYGAILRMLTQNL